MNKLPGPGWLNQFDNTPSWIRFDLGGEIYSMAEPVARFTQAYDRARAIATHVFRDSKRIFAIVSWFPDNCDLSGQPRESLGLEGLAAAGFLPGPPLATWKEGPPWDGSDDPIDLTWYAFDLTNRKDLRDVLLWCAIAEEMPVKPDASAITYLFDPDAQVYMYVYDDRGAELASVSTTTLKATYNLYANWLNDWDGARMAAAFGPANGTNNAR